MTPATERTPKVFGPPMLFQSQKHPFHILSPSPYPILTAFFLFSWLVPQVYYLHGLPIGSLPRADLIHFSVVGLYGTVMS